MAAALRSAARLAASRAVRTCTRPASARGIAGPADQRARAKEHDLPAGQLAHGVEDAARDLSLVRAQLDDDRLLLRLRRREERRVDARREQAVVAREALLGGCADLLGQRDQRVEPAEQLLALRPGRRVAEAVR